MIRTIMVGRLRGDVPRQANEPALHALGALDPSGLLAARELLLG